MLGLGRLPGLLSALFGAGGLVLPLVPFGHGRLGVRFELGRRFAGGGFGTVALVGRRLLPAFAGAIALASSPAAAPSAAAAASALFSVVVFTSAAQCGLLAQSCRQVRGLLQVIGWLYRVFRIGVVGTIAVGGPIGMRAPLMSMLGPLRPFWALIAASAPPTTARAAAAILALGLALTR